MTPRAPRPKNRRPLTREEKLGHLWAGVYVFSMVVLAVVLVGKGCLFEG